MRSQIYNLMSELVILNETFTNGLSYSLLNIIELLSILCGISVVISKNPIVSVLFLIGLFLNVACYLIMLGINFIGLSYLLVYVGAVSILFLFILMLINVRISELTTDNYNGLPLGVIIGTLFNLSLSELLPSDTMGGSHILAMEAFERVASRSVNILSKIGHLTDNISLDSENLSLVTSQIWDGALAEASHITSIGNVIYTSYPTWLILTSIILLLAMVGAIIITMQVRGEKMTTFQPMGAFRGTTKMRSIVDLTFDFPSMYATFLPYIHTVSPAVLLAALAMTPGMYIGGIGVIVGVANLIDYLDVWWDLDSLQALLEALQSLEARLEIMLTRLYQLRFEEGLDANMSWERWHLWGQCRDILSRLQCVITNVQGYIQRLS